MKTIYWLFYLILLIFVSCGHLNENEVEGQDFIDQYFSTRNYIVPHDYVAKDGALLIITAYPLFLYDSQGSLLDTFTNIYEVDLVLDEETRKIGVKEIVYGAIDSSNWFSYQGGISDEDATMQIWPLNIKNDDYDFRYHSSYRLENRSNYSVKTDIYSLYKAYKDNSGGERPSLDYIPYPDTPEEFYDLVDTLVPHFQPFEINSLKIEIIKNNRETIVLNADGMIDSISF